MAGHDELWKVLNYIKDTVDGIDQKVTTQNGRVRALESRVTRLDLAVFGGGLGLVSFVGWLAIKVLGL